MTTQHDERAMLIERLKFLANSDSGLSVIAQDTCRKAAALLAADSRAGGEAVALPHVTSLMEAAISAGRAGFVSGTTNWASHVQHFLATKQCNRPQQQAAQMAHPLTEEQIWGLVDCAEGSVTKFTRAIEAAHGIGKDQG